MCGVAVAVKGVSVFGGGNCATVQGEHGARCMRITHRGKHSSVHCQGSPGVHWRVSLHGCTSPQGVPAIAAHLGQVHGQMWQPLWWAVQTMDTCCVTHV